MSTTTEPTERQSGFSTAPGAQSIGEAATSARCRPSPG
jgi:hypothetical protein